jgi:hypothetical protein
MVPGSRVVLVFEDREEQAGWRVEYFDDDGASLLLLGIVVHGELRFEALDV